ncbi:(Lyso)-N-acylphosphatidylethanolamine lipase-like isoform X1 [Clavelina lepadiformis]|uniref:(Lyso)-N-acylphosphatidylethanolamine lipase-like isoform X1 n=1 Tax=Clavelina lepadiformis TaxID=159417 RepID=UPI0040417D5C
MKFWTLLARVSSARICFLRSSSHKAVRSMASETNGMIEEAVESPMESTSNGGWFDFSGWCKWRPTSVNHLVQAESKMLQFVKTKLERTYIKLASGNELWTIIANRDVPGKTPLVMVHGFGGGIGLWASNLDELSSRRPLYAFDLLGFGRSSRPNFKKVPEEAEEMFVESIEEFRQATNLDKIVLLGHSFGGYLASSYALKYPDRVKNLILVDPWGFPARDPNAENARQIPIWVRALVHILSPFNPLSAVRAAGPWGLNLIKRFRADFKNRFPEVTENDENTVFEYIYHCNAGSPSGESAFKRMTEHIGYSYKPMLLRIGGLRRDVPVTFIYGARTWMDINCGHETQTLLPQNHVEVYSVKGAGHHVYADRPELFHEIVNTVLDNVD